MSTIGALPDPVSGAAGASTKRGLPARSIVVPAGTEPLLPASAQGDAACSRKSLAPKFTNCGSAERLPVPASPPCTQLYVVDATPPTWFVEPCAPPGPVLKYTIVFAIEAPEETIRMPA